MTEAELLELLCNYSQNTQGMFGLLLTVVFAYLVTAYLVGHRLSSFQLAVVSVLFIFGAGFLVIGIYGSMLRMVVFIEQLQQISPDQTFVVSRGFILGFTTIAALSVPVSLFFTYQIRRNPELGAAPG